MVRNVYRTCTPYKRTFNNGAYELEAGKNSNKATTALYGSTAMVRYGIMHSEQALSNSQAGEAENEKPHTDTPRRSRIVGSDHSGPGFATVQSISAVVGKVWI
jgi:hypothetical protein